MLKDLEESLSSEDINEENKDILEPDETERQAFIYARVQLMSDAEYKQFILCR